jgi:hypothetical protein
MGGFEIFMIVSAILSAATAGYSAIAQGNAANAAANAQAAQDEENAKLASQQAANAVDQGQAQKDALRLKMAEMRGQGRTGYAASNVVLGSGSSAEYEGDLADRMQIDLDQIDTNTNLEVWKYKTQQADYLTQASVSNAAGSNAQNAGYWNAGSSLLSGASSVAGSMYKNSLFKQQTK